MTWAEGQRHAAKRRAKAEAEALLGEVVLRVSRGAWVDGEPTITIRHESRGKLRPEQVVEVLRIAAQKAQEQLLAERAHAKRPAEPMPTRRSR